MIRFAQYSEMPLSSVPRRNTGNIPLEGDLRLHETPQFSSPSWRLQRSKPQWTELRECGCLLHAYYQIIPLCCCFVALPRPLPDRLQ